MSQALHEEIERQAGKQLPIAEICRRVGRLAQRQGLTPPSYERVRVLVHEARRRSSQSTTGVLLDVALRAAPPDALVSHLSGTGRRRA